MSDMTKRQAKWLLWLLASSFYAVAFWAIPLAHNPDISYWSVVGGLHAVNGGLLLIILACYWALRLAVFIEDNQGHHHE